MLAPEQQLASYAAVPHKNNIKNITEQDSKTENKSGS